MSTELVKWKPTNAGRKIDEALARIRRSEIVIRRAEPSAVSVRKVEPFGEGKPGEVVDLPRVCAFTISHGRRDISGAGMVISITRKHYG